MLDRILNFFISLIYSKQKLKISSEKWDLDYKKGVITDVWTWWVDPEIANYLGKLVCGEPVDRLKDLSVKAIQKYCTDDIPFECAVSVGCGNAYKEIPLLQTGVVKHFTLYDSRP